MNKRQVMAASYGASRETISKLTENKEINMNQQELIVALNEAFPGIEAAPGELFYGTEEGEGNGIWFRGTESCTIKQEFSFTEDDGTVITEIFGVPIFESGMYDETFGTHPKLEEFLQDRGWYSEAYDSGTLFAYK